jgi:hypothetical protein
MKKIVVTLDNNNNVNSLDGMFIGMAQGKYEEYKSSQDVVLELVKQGLSTEDIIKLKNNDLL